MFSTKFKQLGLKIQYYRQMKNISQDVYKRQIYIFAIFLPLIFVKWIYAVYIILYG